MGLTLAPQIANLVNIAQPAAKQAAGCVFNAQKFYAHSPPAASISKPCGTSDLQIRSPSSPA